MRILHRLQKNEVKRLEGRIAEAPLLVDSAYAYFFRYLKQPKSLVVDYEFDKPEEVADWVREYDFDRVFILGVKDHKKVSSKLEKFIEKIGREVAVCVVMDRDWIGEQYILFGDLMVEYGIPPMDTGENGMVRFRWIRDRVLDHSWYTRRKHWLWELTNPAEMVMYSETFTAAIMQTFAGVASFRCFIDSAHGINYSTGAGLLQPPILAVPDRYNWSVQDVVFQINRERMNEFAAGRGGGDLKLRVKEEMSWISEVKS